MYGNGSLSHSRCQSNTWGVFVPSYRRHIPWGRLAPIWTMSPNS